jgi:hypothetical protein
LSAPTGSFSTFCVALAARIVRLTHAFMARMKRIRSGRSISQSRMIRVTSVLFSTKWM